MVVKIEKKKCIFNLQYGMIREQRPGTQCMPWPLVALKNKGIFSQWNVVCQDSFLSSISFSPVNLMVERERVLGA